MQIPFPELNPTELPMSLITWSDDLSVCIPAMDDDHRQLVSMINELYDAVQEGHGEELTDSILNRLVKYVQFHFAREELFMRTYGFSGYAEHKKHHEIMVAAVGNLFQKHAEDKTSIDQNKLLAFLKSWLLKHIKGEDFKYKVFFQENPLD